jgi:hypothetical protein
MPVANSTMMDTSAVSMFVENHNNIMKTISQSSGFNRNSWSWTVIEMLDLSEKIFNGIDIERDRLKGWCNKFYHDNKPILWMMRGYVLGRSCLGKNDRAFRKCVLNAEFKEPDFLPFFESGIIFDKYNVSYVDAIDFIDNMNLTVPCLPEIGAIHAGQECEYGDWWDDCSICFKRDRAIDKIKKEMTEASNNIFVNSNLYGEFMKAWIEQIQSGGPPSIFAESIHNWTILPIIDTNYYTTDEKYIITDRAELFKKVDNKISDAFKAGKTPRQITEDWLSSIILNYFYFNLHTLFYNIHDVSLKDYELFFKVFYSIEAMDLLLESQRRCAKMIRDMF